MNYKERIKSAAKKYINNKESFYNGFCEGAKWAYNHIWISVKDDLPYKHKELIHYSGVKTLPVYVYTEGGNRYFKYMEKKPNGQWDWYYACDIVSDVPTHWFPIPASPILYEYEK